ncbi:MAG: DNA-processing protein DprA [Oscillospiraceae bacterium]|nr:DNA-processing protein DprA [Oscillospiraceae bacterium]
MKKYYLWLIKVFDVANPDLHEMMLRFGSPREIYNAFRNNFAAAGADYAEKAARTTLEDAEKLISVLEGKGITIITYDDENYPENLKNTDNPPYVLFAKGNTELLNAKLLTIGGTRRVTEHTIASETAICEDLCQEYTFVASLAAGCEQLACLTAIKQGKGCIEVLPCGFDQEYPKGTQVMRQQILMNGGCLLSEFLPETRSSNANYLKRARISGGISKAMIIFQAAANSGSLNAAKYSPALFFLPPEDVFSDKYSAAVSGVRNGAKLYLSPNSLKSAYDENYKPNHIRFESQNRKRRTIRSDNDKPEEKTTAANENAVDKDIIQDMEFETELHRFVYNMIAGSSEAVHFDEIYRNIDRDIPGTSEILLDLESAGMITAVAGGSYMKV